MNLTVKELLDNVDLGDKDISVRAIRELGQKYRQWKQEESYELVKETIERGIMRGLDNMNISQGMDVASLTCAYVKGAREVLNMLEGYKTMEEHTIKEEKEDEEVTKEHMDLDKYRS